MNYYHSVDLRNRDEREFEDHCTFKPKIIPESPFISERTLRRFSQQRLRNAPPPPSSSDGNVFKSQQMDLKTEFSLLPSGQISPSSRSNQSSPSHSSRRSGMRRGGGLAHLPVAGMYSKAGGFSKSHPKEVGVPIYAFDPFFPPNFATGKYGKPVMEEVTIDEPIPDNQDGEKVAEQGGKPKLIPPPLPPWLDTPAGKGGTNATDSAKKIVINRVKKEAVKEEAPSGWQAVLAEMTVKRAQMKNKPPPTLPEKKEDKRGPMKKIELGKRKKPKDFKDIMDELSYKFAVLRGEITEEEDGEGEGGEPSDNKDSSDTKGRFSPVPPSAKKDKPAPPSTDSPSFTRKVGGKPDLAAMLAKIKSPSSQPSTPVPPAAETKEEKKPTLKLPGPPPVAALPAPAPAPAPIGKIAKAKPDDLPGAPPLPSAWPPAPYKAPPDAPKAAPPSSSTNPPSSSVEAKAPATRKVSVLQATQKDLPEGFYIAAGKEDHIEPYEILFKGETTLEFIVKFSEIMDKSMEYEHVRPLSEVSSSSLRQEKINAQAARKLTVSDLPTPPSFAAAVQRLRKSNEIRSAALDLEKQLEYRNYTPDQHNNQTKKLPPSSSYPLSATEHSHSQATTPGKVSFFTDRYFENKQLSFRRTVEAGIGEREPLCSRIDHVRQSTATTSLDADLGTTYWVQSLRSPNPKPTTSQPVKSSSVREEYLKQLKSPTLAQSPHLRSQDTVERRQSLRADKMSLSQQQEREAQEHERRRKETLRQKAMQTAMASGSYRPARRLTAAQKMVEKYGGKPEIGLDLAKVTANAYEQYASQHLGPGPGSSYHENIDPAYQQLSPYDNYHDYYPSSPYDTRLAVDDLLQQYES